MELRSRKRGPESPASVKKRAVRTPRSTRHSTEESEKEALPATKVVEKVAQDVAKSDDDRTSRHPEDHEGPRSSHDTSDLPIDWSSSPSSVVKTPGFAWEEDFVDFLYKPHTITALGLALIAWVYFAYTRNDRESVETNFKAGLTAVIVGFSIYCVLQLRDGLLVRPHPAFWRLVHGLSIMWMLLFVFLLFQNVDVARQWMKYLYSDLGQPLPATDYAKDCRIYTPENEESKFKNVKDVVFDEFIIAHSLGFWGNALMFRDTKICVFLSIFFEILEITFQHWMKNFMECWWDHLIVDVMVCNAFGIWLGMRTVHWLEMKKYNWVGVSKQPSARSKAIRVVQQFSPHSWHKYEWRMFSDWKRFFGILFLIITTEMVLLNGFLLKHTLWIANTKPINTVRLFLWWFLSMPAICEFYQFLTDKKCKRIGPNGWLLLAMIFIETIVNVKFAIQADLFIEPFPSNVKYPWIVVFIVLPIWAFFFFRKKQAGHLIANSDWINILFFVGIVLPMVFMFVSGVPHWEFGKEAFDNFVHSIGLP